MEYKTFPFKIKASVDDAPGSITALVSAKNNIDRVGDKIIDGAYKDLSGTIKDGFGAVGHSWGSNPIMTIESAEEVTDGLLMEMMFHSTTESQDARTVVLERLARGKSVAMSIGYETLKYSYEDVDGKQIRVLEEIKVYEASIVTVPANPRAGVRGAKGWLQEGQTIEQQIESLLDGAGDLESRVKGLSDARGYISQSRRDALKTVIEKLTSLHDAFTPKSNAIDTDEMIRLISAKRIELQIAGIL